MAIAVELCRFLEDARGFTWTVEGREVRHLLHGDLTPANVRLTGDGRVKVLDFGIAKALSLSRKVTRNDFGSLAYLSPERLESGGDMDATDGFWAVGVMLYEMLKGAPPFSAPDTRRLERVIVSRRPAPILEGVCPVGCRRRRQAAGSDAGRSLSERRGDPPGSRALPGGRGDRRAEAGWPGRGRRRARDAPARTAARGGGHAAHRAAAAAADRAGRVGAAYGTHRREAAGPGRRAPHRVRRARPRPIDTADSAGSADDCAATARRAAAPRPRPPSGMRRVLRWALVVLAALTLLNEISVGRAAGRVADTVPSRELETLGPAWSEYQRLSDDGIGFGTSRLRRALTQRTTTLADRVIANYREGLKVVWEPQWKQARDMLARAVGRAIRIARTSRRRCATPRAICLASTAMRARRKGDEEAARQEYADAVTAFREAAELRPSWADPFIGLSRTFIAGLGDVDRGADALNQARRLGYNPGERETAQLAGGYVERGDSLWQSARELRGMPQERDYLTRAVEAYQQALDLYTGVPTLAGVPDQRAAHAGGAAARRRAGSERSTAPRSTSISGRSAASRSSGTPTAAKPSAATTPTPTPTTTRARTTASSDRMAVTITNALQRDTRRRVHVTSSALDTTYLVLVSTSLVAMLAVALAYEGRVRRPPAPRSPPAGRGRSTCPRSPTPPRSSRCSSRRSPRPPTGGSPRRSCCRSSPRRASAARSCPTWPPSCASPCPRRSSIGRPG